MSEMNRDDVVLASSVLIYSPGMARRVTAIALSDVAALDMAIALMSDAPAWTVGALLRGVYTIDDDAGTVTFSHDEYHAKERQEKTAFLAHLRPDEDDF
jgi:hypothetical protein